MNEESHDSEDWREYRQAQQERRAKRLPIRTEAILALRDEGFRVEQKTPYQFRINGRLDLYPTHNRWHLLSTGERGGAQNLADFVKSRIHPNERKSG